MKRGLLPVTQLIIGQSNLEFLMNQSEIKISINTDISREGITEKRLIERN